ncbi:hypothetical protein [Halorussus lipolyticus]|uniref:hypothetical protein n=1 Tax=Halorussus lipolyticus TaxID=3034024 RepID=UPI0023E846EA|nr:hypothetical protein [Halorussus sp. DT80]
MRPDHPVRQLFRFFAVSVLLFIGAVLFLFPEPFTSVLGLLLVFAAVLWVVWSRERIEELEALDELDESDDDSFQFT